MGQQEVQEILEKAREPLSRFEIANILNISPERVSLYIQKMIKAREVAYVEINNKEAYLKSKSKRRMRLYYLIRDGNS